MPHSKVPQVRLASIDQVGSTFYNLYQLVTQIASLYTCAAAADDDPSHIPYWAGLSDGVLEDLGMLFTIWETAIKVVPNQAPIMIGVSLPKRVIRTCNRVEILERHLTVWTPLNRRLRQLRLVELRWQGFLQALLGPLAALSIKSVPLEASVRARLAKLDELIRVDLVENARINSSFDLVMQGNLL